MCERTLYPLYYFVEDVHKETIFLKKIMQVCNFLNCILGVMLSWTLFDNELVRPNSMTPSKMEFVWFIVIAIQIATGMAALTKSKMYIWKIHLLFSICCVQPLLFFIVQYYLSKPFIQFNIIFNQQTTMDMIKAGFRERWDSCKSYFLSWYDPDYDSIKIISPFMIQWCLMAYAVQVVILYTGYRLMTLREIKNNVVDAMRKRHSSKRSLFW